MAHPDRCPTSVHDVGVTKAPIRPSPGSNSPGRLPRSAVGAGDTRPGAQPSNARRGTRHSKVDPKDSRRSDQRDRRRAVTGPKVKIAVCVCRLCGRAELASSGVQRRTRPRPGRLGLGNVPSRRVLPRLRLPETSEDGSPFGVSGVQRRMNSILDKYEFSTNMNFWCTMARPARSRPQAYCLMRTLGGSERHCQGSTKPS